MRKLSLLLVSICLLSMVGCGKDNGKATTETVTEQTVQETTEEVEAKEEILFKDKSQKLYTLKSLNVYGVPEEGTEVIASYTYGSQIEITGVSDQGWYRVKLQTETINSEGFIYCTENDLVAELPSSNNNVTYVNAEQTTQAATEEDKTETSEESTEKSKKSKKEKKKKKATATFTQDEPNYSTEEIVPKEPEVDTGNVTEQ